MINLLIKSFDFFNVIRAMKTWVVNAKRLILLKVPRVSAHDLQLVKQTIADSVYLIRCKIVAQVCSSVCAAYTPGEPEKIPILKLHSIKSTS